MGDATASITVLDTRSRMTAGIATNTNPLWIKGLGIRVPMHRELRPQRMQAEMERLGPGRGGGACSAQGDPQEGGPGQLSLTASYPLAFPRCRASSCSTAT